MRSRWHVGFSFLAAFTWKSEARAQVPDSIPNTLEAVSLGGLGAEKLKFIAEDGRASAGFKVLGAAASGIEVFNTTNKIMNGTDTEWDRAKLALMTVPHPAVRVAVLAIDQREIIETGLQKTYETLSPIPKDNNAVLRSMWEEEHEKSVSGVNVTDLRGLSEEAQKDPNYRTFAALDYDPEAEERARSTLTQQPFFEQGNRGSHWKNPFAPVADLFPAENERNSEIAKPQLRRNVDAEGTSNNPRDLSASDGLMAEERARQQAQERARQQAIAEAQARDAAARAQQQMYVPQQQSNRRCVPGAVDFTTPNPVPCPF